MTSATLPPAAMVKAFILLWRVALLLAVDTDTGWKRKNEMYTKRERAEFIQ